MEDSVDGSWGQLVSVTDVDSPPFPLIEDEFTIGRAKDCDISLANNKLVSGRHCHIEKDAEGQVWLCDTSTNGTLLNVSVKITKGSKKELSHGDEFFVVYKKDEDDINVGYMYQNLEELQKEMNATQEYSSGFEMEATLIDDSINLVEEESSETSKKRSAEDEPNTSTSEPPTKRVKKGETSGEQGSSGTQGEVRDSQGKTTPEVIDDKGKTPPEVKDDKGKTTTEDKDDKGNTPPGDKDVQEEITSEDTKKDCTSKPGEAATSVPCEDRPDEIEEALICTICQELLHDCISLQPCMHSFCAGCYSDWMDKSNECPTCRMKVERINKNHIVNNLIEAYLKENPNKKRDEEDLKELDAKNKISRDMLYSGSKRKVTIFDSSESDSSDSSSPVESPPPNTFPFSSGPAPLLGFGTPVFGTLRPAKTLCRQCPDYKDLLNAANTCTSATATPAGTTGVLGAIGKIAMNVFGKQDNPASTAGKEGATNTAAGSADSEATLPTGDEAQPGPSGEQPDPDVKVMPTAPAYSCAINQTHVLCQCCLQPMPDRRNEYMTNFPTTVPPQQCKLCYRAFCHAYWGCKKIDCNGCIGKFKDINFGKKCLPNLILDNHHESDIFKNYLEKSNLSVKYVLDQCLAKVDTGEFTFRDPTAVPINGDTPLCYPCALRKFKDLAYLFRFSIPKANLPGEVTARPDCHWGKNCRTQRHNINHAQRFNHVCDQTRLT